MSLYQSVRWGEEYTSRALNRKFAGIVAPGVYHGFTVSPGGNMAVLVGHDPDYARSVAVVERDGYSLTLILEDPVTVPIPAAGTWRICIEAFYSPSQQGYQQVVARETAEPHHVVLATVTVPKNDTFITMDMLSFGERQASAIPTADDLRALREELAIRTAHQAATWTVETTVLENGVLRLPVAYVVGAHSLTLEWDGMTLSERNYEEMGVPGAVSTQVRLLFAAPAQSEFQAVTHGVGVARVDLLTALARAISRANSAAEKAEVQVERIDILETSLTKFAKEAVYVTSPDK